MMNDARPAKAARIATPRRGHSTASPMGRTSSRAIQCTQVLHVLGAIALAAQPAWWPWIAAVLVSNHLILIAAVLAPRSQLLGPNVVRLPESAAARHEISLTFDDGPDPEVTPRVLDLLDRYDAKASFFCIGEKAAAFPDTVREIARRGHSIENHSFRHRHAFAFYGTSRLRREVRDTQALIIRITGRPPRFFRAPMGFRSPLLHSVLAGGALRYVSWTRRGYDATRRDPTQVLQLLTRGLSAGDVLLLHDGGHARTHAGEPVVLAVLPALLEKMAKQGLTSVSLPTAWVDAPAALFQRGDAASGQRPVSACNR
jgi:peptidoglycan/xylan/chitin deacetylase (PgdA/CDA1 family)